MKTRAKLAMAASLGLGLAVMQAQAAETVTWGTWAPSGVPGVQVNTVTYQNSAAGIVSGASATEILLSQWNMATMDAHEGGSGLGIYELTSAILSINGSAVGSFVFVNNNAFAATVESAGLTKSSAFTVTAGGTTATESFYQDAAGFPLELNANETLPVTGVAFAGAGIASKSVAAGDLANYIYPGFGSDKLTSLVTLNGSGLFGLDEEVSAKLTALLGSADVSIQYTYVPEPTSLALIGLGLAAVALRRRAVKA